MTESPQAAPSISGDETSPSEAFALLFDNDVLGNRVRDPWTGFAEKRRLDPLWHGSLIDESMLPEGFPQPDVWTAFTFEDCDYVFRNPQLFTSTVYEGTIGMVMGHTILEMDGAEHRQHRQLVSAAFRQRSLARWEESLIAAVCHELIDQFAFKGSAELAREFTFHFPVRVIARILGLPDADYAQFHQWTIELIGLAGDIERGLIAADNLKRYFASIVADRRQHPKDDVISDLIGAEVEGVRLTDELIYSFLLLLLPSGAESIYRSMGSLLLLLLTHPAQLNAVRANRSLVRQSIEEALRFEPPVLGFDRMTTEEVKIRDIVLPVGTAVTPCVGSANRDESRWTRADEFDIFRPQLPHLSFAAGPHMCLGMHLARLEERVALNALLDRLGDLRLDPTCPDPHIQGALFRSPTAVPVLFEAH